MKNLGGPGASKLLYLRGDSKGGAMLLCNRRARVGATQYFRNL